VALRAWALLVVVRWRRVDVVDVWEARRFEPVAVSINDHRRRLISGLAWRTYFSTNSMATTTKSSCATSWVGCLRT
jgi:hypothetical protein